MRILKLLIIMTLVLFPFGELLRWDMGSNVVVKPLDVVVGVAAILFLSSRLKWRDLIHLRLGGVRFLGSFLARNDIKVPLLFFVGTGLVSLLVNLSWLRGEQFLVSLLYLLRWVSYAALLPIVLSFDDRFRKKLRGLLLFDGVVLLVLGYLQYFLFNNLKPYFHLGWDEHMHRMFATFLDPNFAGAFFVLYFLFIFSQLAMARSKNKQKIVFLLIVTLTAVFLTFSRSALLSLIAGSAVFLFLIQKKKLFFLLIAAMALFIAIAAPKFYDENMNLFREASSKARLDNYAVAWRIIQDRPLLGVGFNSYRYAKGSYGIKPAPTGYPSHADAGVDNSFLFVLATTGIIGLIAYCLLLIFLIKKAYFLFKKDGNMLALVVFSSIVALCINAFFINSLFFPEIMLWIWVLLGLSTRPLP